MRKLIVSIIEIIIDLVIAMLIASVIIWSAYSFTGEIKWMLLWHIILSLLLGPIIIHFNIGERVRCSLENRYKKYKNK